MFHGTLRNGAWIRTAPSPYSASQIARWLDVVGYTELMGLSHDNPEDLSMLKLFPEPNLSNLVILSRLHLVAFPFESTTLHYSEDHRMDISYQGLYNRMVIGGSGSYCYGKNGLLIGMLRGLGYRVYPGQARVNMNRNSSDPNARPNYTQLSHMVLFVQPLQGSNITYVVDTAFGVGGLARPTLLSDDEKNVIVGATPLEKHRLRKESHPDSVIENPADEHWQLEVLHETDQPNPKWKVVYSFAETEYFQHDLEGAEFYGSMHPRGSRFVTQVVCVKYFWMLDGDFVEQASSDPGDLNKENRPKISLKGRDIAELSLGYISLAGSRLTLHKGPLNVQQRELKTEQERIEVIRNVFGISVAHDGLDHIRGRASAMSRL